MGNFRILWILSGFLFCLQPALMLAADLNLWPVLVKQWDSPQQRADHTGSLGPIFSETLRGDTRIISIRPLWTTFINKERGETSNHVVYPFFNWYRTDGYTLSSHFNIWQKFHNKGNGVTRFQFFPFIFSQRSPHEEERYLALWPLGGTLKNRFWRERIDFMAWPFYVRTLNNDETRTHFPYPFLHVLRGPESRGFAIWPLYGQFERENSYQHTYALWPFFYNYHDRLDEAVPYSRFGVLPFYTRETAEGLKSETYLWPFFGYTRETEPRPLYSENRYFWPFLVQGRGEERHVNRWMPLFTHEKKPNSAKRWYLWPLLKTETFTGPGPVRERTTFLYFLYRDQQQTLTSSKARLTFLWPLFGYWNDGQNRRQLQVLDPLGVFFPMNKKVKENWSPLFALYRFDDRMGHVRHSLLWDMVVWERDKGNLRSFYAGPLFEWVESSHWEVLKGLIGRDQEDGHTRFRYFWQK